MRNSFLKCLLFVFSICAPTISHAQPAGYVEVYSDVPHAPKDVADGFANPNGVAKANWYYNTEQCCSGSSYALTMYSETPPGESAPTVPFAYSSSAFMIVLQFHQPDVGNTSRYFTSGVVTTVPNNYTKGNSWKYGYFEWEAQVPPDSVPGTWPGLYFKSTDQQSHNFELDVMEHYGVYPLAYSMTITNRQIQPPVSSHCDLQVVPAGGDLAAAMHKFGMLWTSTQVIFYFDGQPICGPLDSSDPVFQNAAYALMDEGEGGASGANDPSRLPGKSTFQIKSFTVWQLPN